MVDACRIAEIKGLVWSAAAARLKVFFKEGTYIGVISNSLPNLETLLVNMQLQATSTALRAPLVSTLSFNLSKTSRYTSR
jgi:hypothetical protein